MVQFWYISISVLMYINLALMFYLLADLWTNRKRLKPILKVGVVASVLFLMFDFIVALQFFSYDYLYEMYTYDSVAYIYSWYSHFIPIIIYQYILSVKVIK